MENIKRSSSHKSAECLFWLVSLGCFGVAFLRVVFSGLILWVVFILFGGGFSRRVVLGIGFLLDRLLG